MSDFRKPRPDFPIVPREALFRTEKPTFFKRPKGRKGRKPKGKKVGKFVARQDPNFKLQKERDEKRKARELAVATAQRRQQLDVAELEDIRERRVDRREARQLALDRFRLEAGRARDQRRFQGAQLQLLADVAGRIDDAARFQAERNERNQERLYAELRAVYDRAERRAGEREQLMVELVDRFTAGGGRVDRGELLALDERVRLVERSQTPFGRGRVEEVSTDSGVSSEDFDLPTPGSRRKRRQRRAEGRGSPRRSRTPSSDEQQSFRSALSRVAPAPAAPAPAPEPEPQQASPRQQTARSPSAPPAGVSPQEERRREFLETGTSGGGSVEREVRSPSVEIATQTEPAQTARRRVVGRKLTPAEQEARARVIAEQARVEIREAEEVLAQEEPEVPAARVPRKAKKGRKTRGGSATPREKRAEERFYERQPSPGTPSPEREEEAVVVERAVERLESPGVVSDALGAVARGVGGIAQGAAEGVVSALPSAEDVGKAVGRGVVGVAVQGLKGAKAVAEVAGEAVIGAVSPEPEPQIGQQTGAPLVPRGSEERLLEDAPAQTPYEQLLALRKTSNRFLIKEDKRGAKKPDHPLNLGTETYERKFRLTDHAGVVGDKEAGRPYVAYSLGGSNTKRKEQIGFVEEAHDLEFEEGEREFFSIDQKVLKRRIDAQEIELEVSDQEDDY